MKLQEAIERYHGKTGIYLLYYKDAIKAGFSKDVTTRFKSYPSDVEVDNFYEGPYWDKDIHHYWEKFFGTSMWEYGHAVLNDTEWTKKISRKDSKEWVQATLDYLYHDKKFILGKPNRFAPRKLSQDICINKAYKAYQKGFRKFLVGAKMRFGKTVVAYWIAKKFGFQNILIMTYKPTDTVAAWRHDCVWHYDFQDFAFCSKNLLIDEDFNKTDKSVRIFFDSFQDFNYEKPTAFSHKIVNNTKWDMIIIDEDHYGAHKKENRDFIDSIKSKNTFVVYMTGTPYREILRNEFTDDNTYLWDYIDEQLAKAAWKTDDNPYADMPKMELYGFDLYEEFAEAMGNKNGFVPSEFFKVKNGAFEKNNFYVKKWLDHISGESTNPNNEIKIDLAIYTLYKLQHGLWKLPSKKACKIMQQLLNDHPYFSQFNVIVLPENKFDVEFINDLTNEHKQTICLTVYKFTAGVSVKKWDHVLMLNGSEDSQINDWFQTVFRAGTPCAGKKVFRVFDFAPNRALLMPAFLAETRIKNNSAKPGSEFKKSLYEVLNYLPLFYYRNNGLKQVQIEELLAALNENVSNTAFENLLIASFANVSFPIDFEFEFNDNGQKLTVNKNEDVKKLLKDKAKQDGDEEKTNPQLNKKEQKDVTRIFIKSIIAYIPNAYYASNKQLTIQSFIDVLRNNRYKSLFPNNEWRKAVVKLFDANVEFTKLLEGRLASIPENWMPNPVYSNSFQTVNLSILSKFEKRLPNIKGRWAVVGGGITLFELALKYSKQATYFTITEEEYLVMNVLYPTKVQKWSEELKMKFDVIISNPPYGKLHLKVLTRMLSLMKENGVIVSLQPIRWLQDLLWKSKPNSDAYKMKPILDGKIQDIEIIDKKEMAKEFGLDAMVDCGIYTISNKKSKFDYDNFVYTRTNKSIYDKVKNQQGIELIEYDENKHEFFVPLKVITMVNRNVTFNIWTQLEIIKHKKVNGQYWKDARYKSKSFSNDRACLGVAFKTEKEAQNFYDSLHTSFYKFCVFQVVNDVNIIHSALPFMSDYKDKWTNERFYQYFNINKTEQKIIEDMF